MHKVTGALFPSLLLTAHVHLTDIFNVGAGASRETRNPEEDNSMRAKSIIFGLVGALVLPVLAGCGNAQMKMLTLEMRDIKTRVAQLETELGRQDESLRDLEHNVTELKDTKPARTVAYKAPYKAPRAMPMSTRNLQLALQRKGYSPGPIDGKMGRRTQAALRAFQRDHSLAVNGNAKDSATLALLTNR
jgi:hypothetical protein